MMSIRRRLLTWLVAGLILLWLVLGAAVFVTVRSSLEKTFDAELQAIASEVRYLFPADDGAAQPKPSAHWLDFFQTDSGLYFEVWDEFLLFSDRSPSLGEKSLPQPPAFHDDPHIWNFALASGERLRGLAVQVDLLSPLGADPEGSEQVLNMVVARNRDGLDQSLALLLGMTALVGVLLIPVSMGLGHVTVRRGLQPLGTFSERVDAFGLESLHERFDTSDMPSELLPVAQRLNGLMQRLEAGLERERRMNADLAHELRTPIAELKTISEVALAWPEKTRPDIYRDILDSVQHMQAVIDGMLLLARCETGVEAPARQEVQVSALIDTCWQPYAAQAGEKGLEVECEISNDVQLSTNPELFQIIVTNLLSNAVEYSPAKSRLMISSRIDGKQVSLVVANRAEGIVSEDLESMFERFWRRDAARGGSGHAGLGLALARSCASVLGLDLSVTFDESTEILEFLVSSGLGADPTASP